MLAAGRLWDDAKNVGRARARRADWLPGRVCRGRRRARPDGQSVALAGCPRLLGELPRDELADWYARAPIYALPARYEPFGLSVLEAALSGCALVLGDIPSLREIWGGAALFVAAATTARRWPRSIGWPLTALAAPELRARPRLRARGLSSLARMAHGYEDVCATCSSLAPLAEPRRLSCGFVIFYHSLVSDWNHGNAHFLRGVARARQRRGHDVSRLRARDALEPAKPGRATTGRRRSPAFERAYPQLRSEPLRSRGARSRRVLDGADVVIVHEWNEHDLVPRIGEHRARGAALSCCCSTTRTIASVTDPAAWPRTICELRRRARLRRGDPRDATSSAAGPPARGPGTKPRTRAFSTAHPSRAADGDLVWVGNWGDDERTRGAPRIPDRAGASARAESAASTACATRRSAPRRSRRAGIEYGGWLPNYAVPDVFARYTVTVHIPRRPYVRLRFPAFRRSGRSKRWPAASR